MPAKYVSTTLYKVIKTVPTLDGIAILKKSWFIGSSVKFVVFDQEWTSNEATILINVEPINDPPIAYDMDYSLDEDTDILIELTATDIENSPVTYSIVDDPLNGSLIYEGNASYRYVPDLNYFGSDSFTYSANDGSLNSNIAEINLEILGINDSPEGDK